jgi:hypothetical protein
MDRSFQVNMWAELAEPRARILSAGIAQGSCSVTQEFAGNAKFQRILIALTQMLLALQIVVRQGIQVVCHIIVVLENHLDLEIEMQHPIELEGKGRRGSHQYIRGEFDCCYISIQQCKTSAQFI